MSSPLSLSDQTWLSHPSEVGVVCFSGESGDAHHHFWSNLFRRDGITALVVKDNALAIAAEKFAWFCAILDGNKGDARKSH